jgi:hypothetical protein
LKWLRLGGRNVSYRLQKSPIVELVDPFQRGELHSFEVSPRPSPMDDLGLLKAVDRFGESVVVAVANTPDRGLDACPRQPLGILDCTPLSEWWISPPRWTGRRS